MTIDFQRKKAAAEYISQLVHDERMLVVELYQIATAIEYYYTKPTLLSTLISFLFLIGMCVAAVLLNVQTVPIAWFVVVSILAISTKLIIGHIFKQRLLQQVTAFWTWKHQHSSMYEQTYQHLITADQTLKSILFECIY